MADDPRVYEIRTVLDFLKVPEDRRALCLSEFATFLKMVEPSCQLMMAVAGEVIGKDAVRFSAMNLYRWIDDDRGAASMFVELPDGSRQQVFDITPDDAADICVNIDTILGATDG